jgi:FkbM family methyltransferase
MSMRKYAYYLFSAGELLAGVENWPLIARLLLKRPLPGPPLIRLRRSGVQFRVRGAMDLWIVKETFLDRFYERYGVPAADGWTVVDVGAGIGDFAILAARGHPNTRVVAFEPFPESFALLQENLRLNGVSNVQALPEAIGGQTGTLSLDLSSGEPLQFSTGGLPPPEKSLTVRCLSLADAFERQGIRHCDLLKLDCEGAEYEILFRAPDALMGRIEHLVMEYHDGVSHLGHQDLVDFLEGKGFTVRTHRNAAYEHLGYLYAFRPQPV